MTTRKKLVKEEATKKTMAADAALNADVVMSIGVTDRGEQRQNQIESILRAVAIRIRSLGGAAVIQPSVVNGYRAISLIVGNSQDDVIQAHAAERVGVRAIEQSGDGQLRRQFHEQLDASRSLVRAFTASLSEYGPTVN